jgi:hypothetical protein
VPHTLSSVCVAMLVVGLSASCRLASLGSFLRKNGVLHRHRSAWRPLNSIASCSAPMLLWASFGSWLGVATLGFGLLASCCKSTGDSSLLQGYVEFRAGVGKTGVATLGVCLPASNLMMRVHLGCAVFACLGFVCYDALLQVTLCYIRLGWLILDWVRLGDVRLG